jgi:hypothetical protein
VQLRDLTTQMLQWMVAFFKNNHRALIQSTDSAASLAHEVNLPALLIRNTSFNVKSRLCQEAPNDRIASSASRLFLHWREELHYMLSQIEAFRNTSEILEVQITSQLAKHPELLREEISLCCLKLLSLDVFKEYGHINIVKRMATSLLRLAY